MQKVSGISIPLNRDFFTNLLILLTAILILTGSAKAANLVVPSSQFPCNLATRPAAPADDSCLQSAINAAAPGDYIILEANRTFVGPYILRYKPGNYEKYITITSSGLNAGFPPAGHRVNPSFAHLMPKIVAPADNGRAVQTELKMESGVPKPAHHYAFVGIEFSQKEGSYNTRLIKLGRYNDGDGSPEQTQFDQVAHDFILDRCYIHKHPDGNVRNGIEIHSAETTIINSHFSEIFDSNSESHLIAGWNGPGPFKINNNFLEGASINILFGGAEPTIQNLIPSDIEFRHNTVRKPEGWFQNSQMSVKNLFELKNARRVLVDRNLFENIWASGQDGTAIVLTPKSGGDAVPWTTVEDVMFSNNIVRRAFGGVRITRGNEGPENPPQRIKIVNNLFADIDPAAWCISCGAGNGKFMPVLDGSRDTVIDHNTILQSGNIISAGETQNTGFVYTNNLTLHNEYGVKGAGASIGNGTLQAYFPNAQFQRNAIIRTMGTTVWNSYYPSNNEFPADVNSTGLIDGTNSDRASRNYRLAPTSPYRNKSAGGKDIGANIDAFNPALRNSDFDSDGKTEAAVFRPSNGGWFIYNSADSSTRIFGFGLAGDIPVAADYDGDGQTDYAVYRPGDKTWYVMRSSDSKLAVARFGLSADIPVPADYDGDGRTDFAVFRPSEGIWYVLGSKNGTMQIPFGVEGDKPMPGDYDGDGRTDFAIWRPSTGVWYIYRSFSRDYTAFGFGMEGDIPIQGDFDGDQRLDVGVWRPSTGTWYVNQMRTNTLITGQFGMQGDVPVLGDFDGDGRTDFSVWRPGSGVWYAQQSSTGFRAMQFGTYGDIPVTTPIVAKP